MSELLGKGGDRKEVLKELIRKLHAGADPAEIKDKFKEVLRGVGPTEIAKIEEELVKEGMSVDEIRNMCEAHLEIFRESLGAQEVDVPPGHPIHTFMEEHRVILQFLEKLQGLARRISEADGFGSIGEELKELKRVVGDLMEVEKHNVREENVLFPYLEKHGITEPPAVMWSEHNDLKELKKKLLELSENYTGFGFGDFAGRLKDIAGRIADMLQSHIYKENNILYPAALNVIAEGEWGEIGKECDELGYPYFTPGYPKGPAGEPEEAGAEVPGTGGISFETGSLFKEEVEGMLDSLPLDITFVDAEDTVRYFNRSGERIFPRTKAVIGRKVQQCHPQKSIHLVNRILDEFRDGRRDAAEFWINMHGRLIYIRYFPVRDREGNYMGCIEVTQDITDIKGIEGEKRLL